MGPIEPSKLSAIYVINLKRRNDRREHIEHVLHDAPAPIHFTSDWDGPFDGAELDIDNLPEPYSIYEGWKLPFESGQEYWDRPLFPGEAGCTLSHLAVWEHVSEQATTCLILEDDVVLAEDFWSRSKSFVAAMETNGGPEMIYLGRSLVGPEPEPKDGVVTEPGYSYGSFGYLLTPPAARAFAHSDIATHIIPADEFLPAMYMDHPRPDIRMLFPRAVTAFAAKPPLVSHAEMGSDSES